MSPDDALHVFENSDIDAVLINDNKVILKIVLMTELLTMD